MALAALAQWEQENQVLEDQRYQFDLDRYAALRCAKPWRQEYERHHSFTIGH
jgi:hypothetical protein